MAASARPGRVLMKAAASQLVIALPRERQTATRRSVTSQAAFPGRPPMRRALHNTLTTWLRSLVLPQPSTRETPRGPPWNPELFVANSTC